MAESSPDVTILDVSTDQPVSANNMLGAYGQWASEHLGSKPGTLSWRNPAYTDLEKWRAEALAKTRELLLIPDLPWKPGARVENYRCRFYPGPHKFDLKMQQDAFTWLDGVLKPGQN